MHMFRYSSQLGRTALTHQYQKHFAKLIRPSPLFNDHLIIPPVVLPDLVIDWGKMERSIKMRKLKINISHLPSLEQNVIQLNSQFKKIDEEKSVTHELIKTSQGDEREAFRQKVKLMKMERTAVLEELRSMQKDFLNSILELPNLVDEECTNEKTVLKCSAEDFNIKDGLMLNWNEEKEDICDSVIGHYLTGRLALLELFLSECCYDWWIHRKYIPIHLSDLVRLTPVQGIGKEIEESIELDPKKEDFVTIEENTFKNPFRQTFLPGSASLESFAAYMMRMQFSNKSLPFKLVTLGNIYHKDKEVREDKKNPINQSKQISLLEAHNCSECDLHSHCIELSETMLQFWSQFSIPIRLVRVPAHDLDSYECLSYSIEYVNEEMNFEIGRISVLGDWVSRRLLIKCDDGNYPQMIYASVFSFEKFIDILRSNKSLTISSDVIDEKTAMLVKQQ